MTSNRVKFPIAVSTLMYSHPNNQIKLYFLSMLKITSHEVSIRVLNLDLTLNIELAISLWLCIAWHDRK